MNPKLVPVLSLSIPVALTAGLWLRLHTEPLPSDAPSPATVAAAHAGLGDGAGGVAPSVEVAAAFDDRVRTLESHVASAPENRELRLALARLLHDGHREREAVEHYQRALEMDPGDAQVHYDLAAAWVALGELDHAEAVLRARLDAVPDDAVAMYDLGAVRANKGDTGAAAQWWRRARSATSDPALVPAIDDALQRLGDPGSRP